MHATADDSGLCCCTCVAYFERQLTPLCVDCPRACGPRSGSDLSQRPFPETKVTARGGH